MVTPRTLQRWRDVETQDDFLAYLALLVTDARDPGSRWTARDLPEFLHAWAQWIDEALTAGMASGTVDAPSRRTLAGQLFYARTAARPSVAGAWTLADPERVTSPADLAAWLRHLGDDCRDDDAATRERAARGGWGGEGRWAHGTDLAGYLDAWHACLCDSRDGRARFKARTWAEMARALEDGKYYE